MLAFYDIQFLDKKKICNKVEVNSFLDDLL